MRRLGAFLVVAAGVALMIVQGILDRQPVQAELLLDRGELRFGRCREIGPDGAALLARVLRDILYRKVGRDEFSRTIEPSGRHARNASREAG